MANFRPRLPKARPPISHRPGGDSGAQIGNIGQLIEPVPVELIEYTTQGTNFNGYFPVPCDDPQTEAGRRESRPEPGPLIPLRRRGFALLQSLSFQITTVICILANAVMIGLETDMPHLPVWGKAEMTFLVIFTVEVLLRVFVYGLRTFLCGRGRKVAASTVSERARAHVEDTGTSDVIWNIFDITIVTAGWLKLLVCLVFRDVDANTTLLRVVRVLRLLRVLRVVRVVRFLKQLYLLAYGFMEGGMAVFWVAVMAASLIYICAIVLVRSFHSTPPDAPGYEFFKTHFYSVPGAMFTLFEIMASPTLGSYREVAGDCPLLTAFIVVFVVFGSLGMNGLLTGVISESIMEKNRARIEAQRQERETRRRMLEVSCSALFDEMVGDPGGRMTLDQFRECKEEIHVLLQASDSSVPHGDLVGMFLAMDYSASGTLEKVDFVRGILELCEDVRPMSIMEIHCQLLRSQLQLDRYHTRVERLIFDNMHNNRQIKTNGDLCGEPDQPVKSMQSIPPSRSYSRHSTITRPSDRPAQRVFNSEGAGLPDDSGQVGDVEVQKLVVLQEELANKARESDRAAIQALATLGTKLSRLSQDNSELLRACLTEQVEHARSCTF